MHKMNRFHWTIQPAYEEQPIKNLQQERNDSHDFFIQSHKGILYRRRSVSVRRLFSTG
jgi:hypothetical protein